MPRPLRALLARLQPLLVAGSKAQTYAVLLCLTVLVGAAWWLGTWRDFSAAQRGVTFGPVEAVAEASQWPLSVNVALEDQTPEGRRALLRLAGVAGLETVRQRFPWAAMEPEPGRWDWQPWDDIVQAVQDEGLQLIALLDGSPTWARAEADVANPLAPPHDSRDFGAFARAFAQRYGHAVHVYQIWDEPNIYPHWGERPVNAGAYADLLREAAAVIRSVDPAARIVSAGLAPTAERSAFNQNDVDYLRALYGAGAAGSFDTLGAKGFGLRSGPEDRQLHPDVLNFSRLALLREVMVEAGDAGTAIWSVEGGWNALPAGWQGAESPWGDTDEATQTAYSLAALERARREWPWLGRVTLGWLQPPAAPDDPLWGFALLDAAGQPRLLYGALRAWSEARLAGVGSHPTDHYAATYEGAWRVSPGAADVGQSGDRVRFRFSGTRLDLEVRRGPYWALLYATVDGQPANALPRDEQGRAYLVLHDPLRAAAAVTLAQGLPDGPHEAELVAEGGWGQWAVLGWRVVREPPLWADPRGVPLAWAGVALSLLGLGVLAWPSVRRPVLGSLRRLTSWAGATASNQAEALGAGWPVTLAWLLCGGVYFAAPWLPLGLVGWLGLFPLTWIRPDLSLALVTFAIPFFLLTKNLGGAGFSSLELLFVLVAGVLLLRYLARLLLQVLDEQQGQRGWGHASVRVLARLWGEWRGRVSLLDLGMLLLVVGGALSLWAAPLRGVALREFRLVLLEPVLFYLLLRGRSLGLSREWVWRLVDALVMAGAALSLWGISQYFVGGGVIEAEGVRRIRALYGSPNNLALFLERVIPLAAAYVLLGRRDWRKGVYGVALVTMMLALYLTFSRGAWFLALPVAFLVIGLLGGWRILAGALVGLVAMAAALIPFWGTARLQSLLDLQGGTGFFRLQLWRSAWNMIRDHPLLGVGPDNFLYLYRTRY
ncbi:MAG: hypothetical protein GX605_12205, partial [Chloroflexi bacterium]|nr:hypothetical protein [Chloroflexota bacterium]